MLIIGAGGHAKEILDVLLKINQFADYIFYDDISNNLPPLLLGKFKIITSIDEAKRIFTIDPQFVLGVGNPLTRKKLADKFIALGGKLESIIAPTANIGSFNITMGQGLNVMHGVLISSNVKIGDGTLINAMVSIHHNTEVGKYCEISPGVHITGGCRIGNFCSIGTGAIVLPKVHIGDYVIIGAGAVVTKNIPLNSIAKGVPAKIYKKPN